jgi:hypothetical protein
MATPAGAGHGTADAMSAPAPGSFSLRAIVTVTRASAIDRRETGVRFASALRCQRGLSWAG